MTPRFTPDRCLGVDHSGCCGDPGRQRGWRAGYLGEMSAADGEHRDELHAGAVDEQVLAVRGQTGVEVESGALDGEAADQGEGTVQVDGVAGDGARIGVDGEQVFAVRT